MPHALTDHETIRRWAEACGVVPAAVDESPDHSDHDIRLATPDAASEASVRPVTWAAWFQRFEQAGLALVIDDATRQPSTFNQLVPRASLSSGEPDAPGAE